ncbi:MAG: dihydroorotase family protein [bacterium]|nr:dihydroorotase family protein [bacterium]MDE0600901.1 dihydroorotase family protein [bacterium]
MTITRIIRGASVVRDGSLIPMDILVSGEQIAGLSLPGLVSPPGAEITDADGLWALPGGVDVHVHLREPGYTHKEDIESATRAAAAGGYTTVFGMPNVKPPTMTASDLRDTLALYDGKSLVDYNHNPAAKQTTELAGMAEMGIAAYKIYMVADTGRNYPHPASIGVHDHGHLLEAMEAVAATGLALMVHPHDQRIEEVVEQRFWAEGDRSPEAYARTLMTGDGLLWDTATSLLLRMAEATGCRLHIVHTTTSRQVEMIRAARRRGVKVTCEVNHWTLFLATWELVQELGPYVLSYWVPAHHQQAVWDALADGSIDILASDHAPHTREEKDVGYEDMWAAHTGSPGIQYQLPLLVDAHRRGRISLERLVDAASTAPARLFGLPRKGRIEPGADADLVLIDPDREWTITNDSVLSKIDWTPYHGRTLTGAVERTIVRGVDVYAGGEVVGEPGHGRQAVPDAPMRG